ncbi:MAG: hypothetical protein DRP42_04420 [Tenericutes bacterium]|nr:MAG: hypothetical protein DRP42_04420 [Mycoplasmatota bacterium]
MEYKYLDIRRPNQANIIKFRSDFNKIIRTFMDTQDFTEVETPIITKPTPGGAAEFQVLSNNHEGEYYSLVQSPQIYKQLLMYGGVDKYYQLAKCFRDEAGRKDRQIEFTQLDIEQAFVSPETIQTMVESLLSELFQKMLDKKIEVPFVRLSHEQAMDKYGSDKPHLGFGNELVDVTTAFEDTDLNFVKDAVVKGSIVKSIFFEQSLSRKQVDKFDTQVKEQGGNGLA